MTGIKFNYTKTPKYSEKKCPSATFFHKRRGVKEMANDKRRNFGKKLWGVNHRYSSKECRDFL
jgi:hypothetical protein